MAGGVIGSIVNQLAGGRSFRIKNELTGMTALNDIGVKDVEFNFNSRLMINPGENGQPIIDARVLFPTEISVNIVCNSSDKVAAVNALLMDLTNTYTILSRGILLTGFMVDLDSMSQKAAMISATPIKINFKQIMLQGGGSPICAQAGDSSTILGGIKNSINVTADKVTDLSNKLTSAASEFFGG